MGNEVENEFKVQPTVPSPISAQSSDAKDGSDEEQSEQSIIPIEHSGTEARYAAKSASHSDEDPCAKGWVNLFNHLTLM